MLDLFFVKYMQSNLKKVPRATWWMANQVKKNHAGKSMMITPTSLARFAKKQTIQETCGNVSPVMKHSSPLVSCRKEKKWTATMTDGVNGSVQNASQVGGTD